jgi:hypothetical protein
MKASWNVSEATKLLLAKPCLVLSVMKIKEMEFASQFLINRLSVMK